MCPNLALGGGGQMSFAEIRALLLAMDDRPLPQAFLEAIAKQLPDKDEVARLEEYRGRADELVRLAAASLWPPGRTRVRVRG